MSEPPDAGEAAQEPPGDTKIRAALEAALRHLNRGELSEAENLLRPLAIIPIADALQLLGVIRGMQGQNAEAESFYRQSLQLSPAQPQIHHNLGILLRSQGRLDEAIGYLREAIRLKPNYAEAHLSLALAHSAKGDHVEAEKCCRQALRLQPNYILAKQCLAAELNELERPAEAERLLRQTLVLGVRDPAQTAALEHNLGVALNMQRRHREALGFFEAAQQKVPELPFADYNRGIALQHVGRLEEALACYRRAIMQNPLNMLAHRDLNQLLYRLGDDATFLSSYDEVAALFPEVGEIHFDKGNFLYLQEHYESARQEFERAAHLLPQQAAPHDALGLIFANLKEYDAAVREHEIAVGMEPNNAQAWRNYAETLLRAASSEEARRAAERSLEIEPDSQIAIAIWGLALRQLSDAGDEGLNDYEKLVRVYEIAPPPGYKNIESFNADLDAWLDCLHRDRRECIDQTLRSGTQTLDDIFGAGHQPVELLRAQIDIAVADYVSRMDQNDDHPLFRRRRAEYTYAASWSSRLRDCGFHTNHVHPKGWISSAYYVALPDAVERPGSDEGWIKFGEPNFDCGLKEPVRRTVKPVSGLLVLFPSYMWHGTQPFRSSQSRTTIAFDVVPRGR
ncbi:MAG TPA: tetratricopeptide repeat protein [Rhizomicrobium sp.]|nr:tetratricopeptide repeat protein [Rhizomicrobium sp.]